jgi:hypothetical protein
LTRRKAQTAKPFHSLGWRPSGDWPSASTMTRSEPLFRRPFAISDWLELGDQLTPSRRNDLLAVFEEEEARLGGDRENLRRAERMMAEGKDVLDKLRRLRGTPELRPDDLGRLEAVIHTVEQTQRVIASHYARLAREWLRCAGPSNRPHAAESPEDC